jgi:hypothetical protein
MSAVSNKTSIEKGKRSSRKFLSKNNTTALQEKLNKANNMLSKISNPEALK